MNDTRRTPNAWMREGGNVFKRFWHAGATRTVVVQRLGTRYLSVPLNVGIVLLGLLLIGTAPMWPLLVATVIVALIAKVEIVVYKDAPPTP